MRKREEAIENARSSPQVVIPQSIQEIILNSWQGDEVNNFNEMIKNDLWSKMTVGQNDRLFSKTVLRQCQQQKRRSVWSCDKDTNKYPMLPKYQENCILFGVHNCFHKWAFYKACI